MNKVYLIGNLTRDPEISTTTSGAITKPNTSSKFPIGKTGILNTCLNAGTTKIIPIKNADARTASISILFPKIPVCTR